MSEYFDNTGKSLKVDDLTKNIKKYKESVFENISHDIKFIKVHRYIFMYLFTAIMVISLVISFCILMGAIKVPEKIEAGVVYTFLLGVFIQTISLMIIIFKFLFEPLKETMKHTIDLIVEEKVSYGESRIKNNLKNEESDDNGSVSN